MITLLGRPSRCCEGLNRREWLRLGGLGSLGLGLPDLLRARSRAGSIDESGAFSPREPSFGRARACIVLFMFGAPAHQDIWDLKPEAPSGVRGEFQPISSAVPGLF